MSCTTSTLKFLSFIMNILCYIFGGLAVSASIYALVDFNTAESIRAPCIIGITLGSILFFVNIVGCWATLRESIALTSAFTLVMFLLMLAQILLIIFWPLDFAKLAAESLNNAWRQQMTDNTMATYEIEYYCCGKTGPQDYGDSGLVVPSSCYVHQDSSMTANLYTDGCLSKLTRSFMLSSRIEIMSDWTLVGVEAATALVASMQAINLKNMERRQRY